MQKSTTENKSATENKKEVHQDNEKINAPFTETNNDTDEIGSDGSGNAFEKTEIVEEDNFDKLSEK